MTTPLRDKTLRERLSQRIVDARTIYDVLKARADDPAGSRDDVLLAEIALRNYNAILDAEAAEAVAVDGWRDIASAPKDGRYVLLFGDAHWPQGIVPNCGDVSVVVGVGQYSGGNWQFAGRIGAPTHWQPLPAAPSPAIPEESK